MRNYKKYRSRVLDLFESFLVGKIEKIDLISELKEIDKEIRKNPKTLKGLWFRFSKDDALVTTITDLHYNIESTVNRAYTLNCIQQAINNPKELQIYYS